LAYRLHRGVSQSTADALFGVYALGLIPASADRADLC
jgi:hypothetical protein